MTIGSIGKALVSEAIESTKSSVIDAVTGKPSTPAAAPPPATPPATSQPVSVDIGAVIVGQIQAMQRPLKEDQELAVTVRTSQEALRVSEIFVPTPGVLVFAGADALGNVTRLITPASAAQVVCKVLKVAAGAAPLRVNILTPRPQQKPAA